MTWKIIKTKQKLLKQSLFAVKPRTFLVFKKSIRISPIFLNHSFKIHNGKNFINITVTENHLGRMFGEFISTRKLFDKGVNSKYKKIWKRKTKKKPIKVNISNMNKLGSLKNKNKNYLSEKRYKHRTVSTIRLL